VGNKIDPILMRLTGGRVNTTGTDAVVILHHVGAKTGKARQTPLVYFTDGPNVVLIASNGGSTRHPAWLHNIRANPDVELWVGKRGGAYRARVATPDERVALWPKANAFYSGYDRYQELAGDREIQIVICAPRMDG
jgi:deazaflavin-dependent oxidoreductase (nitroreductase family)